MAAREAGFAPERIGEVRQGTSERLSALGTLLDRRRAEGKVRRCHGDLHLRNVCLFEGKPTLFDCLEFSDELACVDILYDLAFLLMDLEHRGLADFANLVLNRYLDLTGEDDGLAAMPLFLSLRAAIRAHVTATVIDRAGRSEVRPEMAADARGYLDLAAQFLRPRSCRLVAIGGLSGSGKSTLAAALAPSLGARVLRSDVIRKHLFGVAPETRLPASAYTSEVSRRVYEHAAPEGGRCACRGVFGDHRCRIAEARGTGILGRGRRGRRRPVFRSVARRRRRRRWTAVCAPVATTPRMPLQKSSHSSSGRIPGRWTGFASMPVPGRRIASPPRAAPSPSADCGSINRLPITRPLSTAGAGAWCGRGRALLRVGVRVTLPSGASVPAVSRARPPGE